MICHSCRYAGNVRNQAAGQGEAVSDEKAAELHAKCPGYGWCDCQHKLPVPRPAPAPTLD